MNLPTLGHPSVSRLSHSAHEVAAIRLGGFAAVAAGALMVGHQIVDVLIGDRTTDGPRALLHTAWLAALFLAVRGVRALQRSASDRVGDLLLRLALAGVGAMVLVSAVEAVLVLTTPDVAAGDPSIPVLVVLIGSLVLLAAGLLGFAIAVVRAGVLPRSTGPLLLAGILVQMLAPGPVPSLAFFGLTVAWLGVAMLRRVGSGAEV